MSEKYRRDSHYHSQPGSQILPGIGDITIILREAGNARMDDADQTCILTSELKLGMDWAL